jgi:hypothetical protein
LSTSIQKRLAAQICRRLIRRFSIPGSWMLGKRSTALVTSDGEGLFWGHMGWLWFSGSLITRGLGLHLKTSMQVLTRATLTWSGVLGDISLPMSINQRLAKSYLPERQGLDLTFRRIECKKKPRLPCESGGACRVCVVQSINA